MSLFCVKLGVIRVYFCVLYVCAREYFVSHVSHYYVMPTYPVYYCAPNTIVWEILIQETLIGRTISGGGPMSDQVLFSETRQAGAFFWAIFHVSQALPATDRAPPNRLGVALVEHPRSCFSILTFFPGRLPRCAHESL